LENSLKLEFIAEAFNVFNTLNVRFFNTTYGAADFCPFNPATAGCVARSTNREGSLIRRKERHGLPSIRGRCSLLVRVSF
jgi:hypothetical protein